MTPELLSKPPETREGNRPAVHLIVATGNRLKAETIAEELSGWSDVLVFQMPEVFREGNLQQLADNNGMKDAPAHSWTKRIAHSKVAIQQYYSTPEVLMRASMHALEEKGMEKPSNGDMWAIVTVDTARQVGNLRLDKPTNIDNWRNNAIQWSGMPVTDVATMHVATLGGGSEISGQVVTTSWLRPYTSDELELFVKQEGNDNIAKIAGGISLYRQHGRSMHNGIMPLIVNVSVNGKELPPVVYPCFENVSETILRGLVFAAPVVKPLLEALQ